MDEGTGPGQVTARRGKGEGSVYRTEHGWEGFIEAGRNPTTGKRRRLKRTGKTKAEVMRKLDQARQELEKGLTGAGGATRLDAWLDLWLKTVVANRVGKLTLDNYTRIADNHLKPGLGKITLAKLTPQQVTRLLEVKADQGLSASQVRRMKIVLADALGHAEHWNLIGRNAARLAVMPKCKDKPEGRALTPDEARQLLATLDQPVRLAGQPARPERLGALIATGLMTGLRPGELTGLLWADLDLDSTPPTLTVSGSMKRVPRDTGGYDLIRGAVKKSTAGYRTVVAPPDLARRLKDHRRRQLEERIAVADLWQDHGLVFPSEVGTPLDPPNVIRAFRRMAKRAGIEDPERITTYTLRHTAASLLIDQGKTIEEVADLLGDRPETLYLHYRHRIRPVVDTAATVMQDLFGTTG